MHENVFWLKNVVDGLLFFVCLVQVYTDKTALNLRTRASVASLVGLVLLNFSKTFCRFLNNHGHTLVALLLVATPETSTDSENTGAALKHSNRPPSIAMPLSDELPSTSSTCIRAVNWKTPIRPSWNLTSANDNAGREFQVFTSFKASMRHPTVASYYSDTSKNLDRPRENHAET